MKSSPWQGEDGVISEGASRDANNDGVGFKCEWDTLELGSRCLIFFVFPAAVLIRALHETYIRSDNADLKNLIKSYTNVQVRVPVFLMLLVLTDWSIVQCSARPREER